MFYDDSNRVVILIGVFLLISLLVGAVFYETYWVEKPIKEAHHELKGEYRGYDVIKGKRASADNPFNEFLIVKDGEFVKKVFVTSDGQIVKNIE